ncbi:MAG: Tat (twin-arginine translocation) pathway signal sequence containing protein [Chitinophagaceae bacterium]
MEIIRNKKEQTMLEEIQDKSVSRRNFLRSAGILGASVAMIGATAGMTGCKKNDNNTDNGVDLGSGDIGVLNYAYALEQLEAAFYTRVAATPYSGISASETAYLTDIRDHEIAHREFFKTALGANAIGALEVDFSSINFGDRTSVLNTAKAFEDLGVSAYNGAGRLLTNATYLLLAGKIVSVEARHAALIRDILTFNSFAASDVIDANGLDFARTPSQVLSIAGAYIKTKINASNLPS